MEALAKSINAKDLKINDKFRHDELRAWQVMATPTQATENTIKVYCWNTGTGKTKMFEFGNNVSLDLIK